MINIGVKHENGIGTVISLQPSIHIGTRLQPDISPGNLVLV